jgi:hypothetical protein
VPELRVTVDGVAYRVYDARLDEGVLRYGDPPARRAHARLFRAEHGERILYWFQSAGDRETDEVLVRAQLESVLRTIRPRPPRPVWRMPEVEPEHTCELSPEMIEQSMADHLRFLDEECVRTAALAASQAATRHANPRYK